MSPAARAVFCTSGALPGFAAIETAVSVLPVTAELRPFPTSDLVAGDEMLAQKIALETNERGALSVAHRSFVSMDPRR